jgi:hypothetical protein
MTLTVSDTLHNNALPCTECRYAEMSHFIEYYAECCYAECRYAECRGAHNRNTECRYVEYRGATYLKFRHYFSAQLNQVSYSQHSMSSTSQSVCPWHPFLALCKFKC